MNSSEKTRLLVIDDEKGLRDMLVYTLSKMGFAVSVAPSGEEGLDKARAAKFDVVLCDIMMPGMGGVETLRAFKAEFPEIGVVMATGFATVETAVACTKLGAYDFIAKPFELPEVKAILERAAGNSRSSKAPL